YPQIITFAYPKPGTTNSAVRVGTVPLNGGATTWMKTSGDPRNTYIASLDWIDASTVAMQQLNRLQNENNYLLGDPSTGNVTRVFQDTSFAMAGHPTWVDVQEDVKWIDGDKAFLWVSERDGLRHVYKVSRATGAASLITKFESEVTNVVDVDEKLGA